jgi:hypothetical protein
MMDRKPTREEAWKILTDHVRTPNLLSHALAVEAAMRHVFHPPRFAFGIVISRPTHGRVLRS